MLTTLLLAAFLSVAGSSCDVDRYEDRSLAAECASVVYHFDPNDGQWHEVRR